MIRLVVSVVGLVSIASPRAEAQRSDMLSAAQRAGVALARLGAGQRVRLRSSGVGLVEGGVVSSSPTLVTLRTDGSRIAIPGPTVDSLWVRGGSHAGRGALVGGAVAGIGLGALAAGVASHPWSDCPGCTPGAWFAGGFVVGAVGGALIGALIGAASPTWQLRFP